MAWGASCRRCQDGVHVGWTRDVAGRPLERHTWRADRFAGGPEGGLTEALDARSYLRLSTTYQAETPDGFRGV